MNDQPDEAMRRIEATLAEIKQSLDRIEAVRQAASGRELALIAAAAEMRATAAAVHCQGDDIESRRNAWQFVVDAQGVAAAAGVIIAPNTRH